jgi:DNA polymerase V
MLIFANSMAKMHILPSEFSNELSLQFAPGIKAGFPSPAQDYRHDTLDFNRDFIRHPEATFYGRVDGDSMMDAGINDGDIAVIDRSLEANDGDVIVAYVNEEFTIKFLDLSHKDEGYIELRPANKHYYSIKIDVTDEFEVWGVVVWTIKNWKK